MPLVELVETSRMVNVSRNLVIKHNGTALVIAGRKHLYKLPPVGFITVLKILASIGVQRRDYIVSQEAQTELIEIFATEIFNSKVARMDFVHS